MVVIREDLIYFNIFVMFVSNVKHEEDIDDFGNPCCFYFHV